MNKHDYKAMFSQVRSVASAHPNKMEVIMMNRHKHKLPRKPILVLAALAILAALSVTAYALVALLSPAEIARELGHDAIAQAFESGEGTLINESVTSQGYVFTLMGLTSGKNLDFFESEGEQTVLLFAVRREDGQPVSVASDSGTSLHFRSCAVFSGCQPWTFNSFTLGFSFAAAHIRDGVYYMALGIDDNLEMLADHTVCYAIWDGDLGFPSSELFAMAQDGTISFADGLQKPRAMFTLPLDPAKADPARVARLVEALEIPAIGEDPAPGMERSEVSREN